MDINIDFLIFTTYTVIKIPEGGIRNDIQG